MRLTRRKNRRRRPLGKRLVGAVVVVAREVPKLLKIALVIAMAAALPVGIYHGYHALMRSEYFVVTAIDISGNERVPRREVLELAGLDSRVSIFQVDTDRIADRLLSNPWVVATEVSRELPRTIRIVVDEREPAGWLYWDGLYRVDAEGDLIEAGSPAQLDGPVISGLEPTDAEEEGGERAARIRTALSIVRHYASQGLERYDRVGQIHYDELLGFSLLTADDQIEIRLGHDRFFERLQRLRDVMATLEGEAMAGRYILLDGEGDLTRVAVGPVRPGRDANGQRQAQDVRQ